VCHPDRQPVFAFDVCQQEQYLDPVQSLGYRVGSIDKVIEELRSTTADKSAKLQASYKGFDLQVAGPIAVPKRKKTKPFLPIRLGLNRATRNPSHHTS
jgi:hypothetical protein